MPVTLLPAGFKMLSTVGSKPLESINRRIYKGFGSIVTGGGEGFSEPDFGHKTRGTVTRDLTYCTIYVIIL